MIAEATLCMALNLYHEARNQPLVGQIAVAQVVLNRVKDKRFPDTVCGVVKQARTYKSGFPIKYKCHFSWYCDGKSDKPKDKRAWNKAIKVATNVLSGKYLPFLNGATHYHTINVRPSWASSKTKITLIEDHIFYRWESR